MYKPTEEKIKETKAKHGGAFLITVGDKACLLRSPKRKDLSYAASVSDGLKSKELMLQACWIEGDEEIKTDDAYFLGAAGQLDNLVEIKEAQLKKL